MLLKVYEFSVQIIIIRSITDLLIVYRIDGFKDKLRT